jgi:transcriptional regulator with XRE-family HTH domain
MDDFDNRVMRQLGRRVRRRRRFLDLSQEVVAERAGIHRTMVSLYENGERQPLTTSLVRLAAALGLSVGRLLTGIGWEVPGPPLRDPRAGDPWDPEEAGDFVE